MRRQIIPPKDDRIVAEHILTVLEESKKKALRFRDLKIEMAKRSWIHSDTSINQNCHWLIGQGKISKNGALYNVKVDEI